ncbi:MAG: Fe-S protein assembly co-chaperone HscB [Burkholderiaceae bacterium]|nr:Fe-S protein assembly co-chaperone HscB [Burkholderiaceae bacterium]
MSTAPDHFALFGLVPRFAIDLAMLEAAYKDVQGRVHPDRFAAGTPAERRVAMQWATRANEAYRALRDDAQRAAYLCEHNGAAIDAESNTTMPPAFLMQQMQWRESLDEARAAGQGSDALRAEVNDARDRTIAQIGAALDEARDYPRAAALVRQLMFIDRFIAELDSAHAAAAHGAEH